MENYDEFEDSPDIKLLFNQNMYDVNEYDWWHAYTIEIFDLGGFYKRFPHITKLAYCIHAISLSSA